MPLPAATMLRSVSSWCLEALILPMPAAKQNPSTCPQTVSASISSFLPLRLCSGTVLAPGLPGVMLGHRPSHMGPDEGWDPKPLHPLQLRPSTGSPAPLLQPRFEQHLGLLFVKVEPSLGKCSQRS